MNIQFRVQINLFFLISQQLFEMLRMILVIFTMIFDPILKITIGDKLNFQMKFVHLGKLNLK